MKTQIGDIVANDKATKDSPNYLGVITSIEKWSKGLVYKVEFRDTSIYVSDSYIKKYKQ